MESSQFLGKPALVREKSPRFGAESSQFLGEPALVREKSSRFGAESSRLLGAPGRAAPYPGQTAAQQRRPYPVLFPFLAQLARLAAIAFKDSVHRFPTELR